MAALAAAPAPVCAGWGLVSGAKPVAVAKSTLTVTPVGEWNRLSRRPSPKSEAWTRDGLALNELMFISAVVKGETLFKERNKKDKPLPKFDPAMLAPDLVQLYESSARIVLNTSAFNVDEIKPAALAGHDGVQFSYTYAVEGDNLQHRGEARAAIIDGKLYVINFAAASIHYFDASIAEVRAMMDNARI